MQLHHRVSSTISPDTDSADATFLGKIRGLQWLWTGGERQIRTPDFCSICLCQRSSSTANRRSTDLILQMPISFLRGWDFESDEGPHDWRSPDASRAGSTSVPGCSFILVANHQHLTKASQTGNSSGVSTYVCLYAVRQQTNTSCPRPMGRIAPVVHSRSPQDARERHNSGRIAQHLPRRHKRPEPAGPFDHRRGHGKGLPETWFAVPPLVLS